MTIDFDYTDEQEMRAAGHPAAQVADYEPPELREALSVDLAADQEGGDINR